MIQDPSADFLITARKRLRYYKSLGESTFAQLEENAILYSPGPESNSIAVIVQHLSGNMLSRWTNFLTEDGEKSWRERDAEFEVHSMGKQEMLELWEKGWSCFFDTLDQLKPEDLTRVVTIRGESLTVTDAINRQLAHYPYHIGQIVYLGRMIAGEAWKSLSIPKGGSAAYNSSTEIKDPAKKH